MLGGWLFSTLAQLRRIQSSRNEISCHPFKLDVHAQTSIYLATATKSFSAQAHLIQLISLVSPHDRISHHSNILTMPTEQPYRYMQADDSSLIARYGAPVPPSSLSLLEADHKLASQPRSFDTRSSLLLDASDELGMQLLVSSATVDCQDFKVLSYEEVERLKREQALLANRIDAHTRKLALESKVRDASQNLVRLHANRNKRMSKQAEDQAASAIRKVDDLATDLWRLQRRAATIKQQLLEHFAGVLARSVTASESARKHDAYQDFDDNHLYRENGLSAQNTISTRAGTTMTDDLIMRAESRLRESNRQIRKLIGKPLKDDDKDVDLDTQISRLDDHLLQLQEEHLTQRERTLRSLDAQQSLLQRIWSTLSHESDLEYSDQALEQRINELMNTRMDASAEQTLRNEHAMALKTVHQQHDRELDKVHEELEQSRETQATLLKDLSAKRQMIEQHSSTINDHEARHAALQQEMSQIQSYVEQLSAREASARNFSTADRDMIQRLEAEIAELQESSANTQAMNHSELTMHKTTVAELEHELEALKGHYTLRHEELQQAQYDMEEITQAHERSMAELTQKYDATVEQLTSKRDRAVSQIELYKTELATAEESIAALQTRLGAGDAGVQEELIKLRADYAAATSELANLRANSQEVHLTARLEHLEKDFARIKLQNQQLEDQLAAAQRGQTRDDALAARCHLLQTELDGMLVEYEAMTRSALLYENERTAHENKMDDLMDRIFSLESQLSDEKVKNLGGLAGDKDASSATASLRKEFRRLVQDMRSDHAKQTREDYTEIKRLERQLADAVHT